MQKNPEDLRRLTVTQTLVKDHQLKCWVFSEGDETIKYIISEGTKLVQKE